MIKFLTDVRPEHAVLIPLNQLNNQIMGFYVNGAVYVSNLEYANLQQENYEERAAAFEVIDVEAVYGEDREHFFGIETSTDIFGSAMSGQVMRMVRTDSLICVTWLPETIRAQFLYWVKSNHSYMDTFITGSKLFYTPQTLWRFWEVYTSTRSSDVWIKEDGWRSNFSAEFIEKEGQLTKEYFAQREKSRRLNWQTFAWMGTVASVLYFIIHFIIHTI